MRLIDADDCDGDKRVEYTDTISRADAFEIIDKAFSQPMRNGVTIYADICLMLNALPTHANSRSTHARDLISKDDAIEEISKGVWNVHELIDRINALPSAEAKPTVIRSKTLLPTKDFKEWAKRE